MQFPDALNADNVNVGPMERWGSTVGGGLLTAWGLKRGGISGTVLGLAGAALVKRGVTGHCEVYGALGMDTSDGNHERWEPSSRGVDEQLRTRPGPGAEWNRVDEASAESFPASDPPAY